MSFGQRLSGVLAASWPRVELRRFDPIGAIQRMDAAYRERRRMEELTPEMLEDVGLTRSDIEKALRR